MNCAHCKTRLPDGAKFCFNCGQPIGGATAPAAQTIHGPQTNVLHASGQVFSGVFNLYQQASLEPPRLSDKQFKRVLDGYLTWVWKKYSSARLHGLQKLQSSGPLTKLSLPDVYVSLRVSQRPAVQAGGPRRSQQDELARQEQAAPVDMTELLTLGQRVVIVGGAGCGKTTYLAFVAASLALALGGGSLDRRLKPHRPGGPLPIPFVAPLRFWNVYRQAVDENPAYRLEHPEAGSIMDFLLWYLRYSYGAGSYDAASDFFRRLLSGGSGLLMFDGLDEIVSRQEREIVREEISRLLDHPAYQDNLCLVTAREAGFNDAPFGSDYVRCDVQAMDEDQIAALVDAWCSSVAELDRDYILSAIHKLNQERRQRGQEPLVSTPLMVTMIVSACYSQKSLPEERATLYDVVIQVILQSQYSFADHHSAREQLVAWGGQLPPDKQREWLALLAFDMHRSGEGAVVDEDRVRQLLTPALEERGELELLDAFVSLARGRGGLFEERGEVFQFMHLTFQEYLAGQHLSSHWLDERHQLPAWVTQSWWREVLLLAIGSLDPHHHRSFAERSAFITHLLALDGPPEAQMAAAELAATGLLDLRQAEETLCGQARERLARLLTDQLLTGVSASTRAAAGRALSALDDPRPGVRVIPPRGGDRGGEPLPDIAWRSVPGGELLMGSAQGDDLAYDDEHGPDGQPFPVQVRPFFISAYPITNAQFRPFVQGDGYTNPAYWTPEGWQRKENEKWTAPRYWDDPRWNLDNHPVVDITWYEAVAYCKWVNREIGKWANGQMGKWEHTGWQVLADASRPSPPAIRLPTEVEWEWTARGPEGLRWPWGDAWGEGLCNSSEAGVGRTSAVGAFPGSAARWLAQQGAPVHDLAGNVLEWCATRWQDKYPLPQVDEWSDDYLGGTSPRVFRGGSWAYYNRDVRGAIRYGYAPHYQYNDLGFRVAAGSSSWL